ncbi:uncharacterized protein MONBRDRAFT_13665 [Monosiga brevicollis MX1]|uniref:RRM domain-containing protein n=1 Tax=Monosiga brevicollis TaxID=81824 RepID=A9UQC7_MONBE|nr:uncharacterized protein MONBRDRAFT_13665 [Monosiga brevicollis MX1]EDQ92575.1 predicted protein [Monosiga brevicollis MX1]|eukprot:XP_001742337.1 hypothetical protein [Monosiga brevicollis MX1]
MGGGSRRVYVGNLPRDIRERELDELFYKYGRILDIHIKGPYAFVTFEDERDAEDAVHGRDGINFAGGRLRVELSNPGRRGANPRDNFSGKHSEFRVLIKGLPRTASWQDVKDFFKDERLDVVFTDVNRDGVGMAEFGNQEDMNFALDKMNGRKLNSHLVRIMAS